MSYSVDGENCLSIKALSLWTEQQQGLVHSMAAAWCAHCVVHNKV